MSPNILFCNRDVYCKNCDSKLGWMYEFATEDNQRFTTIFIWAWPALYTYVLYNIRQVQRRQSHFGKSSCSRVWWHWGTPHQWLILTNHFCTQYIVKYHFTHNTFCLVSSYYVSLVIQYANMRVAKDSFRKIYNVDISIKASTPFKLWAFQI